MVKTFKLRYVNEIVGVFVLIAVGFLIFGIVLAMKGQGWLSRQQSLQIQILLPEEGSMGLKPGDNVQVLGTVIGSVDIIRYDKDEQRMVATINVRGELIDYLKTDSIPILHSSFGIGASYVEIEKNPKPDPTHPGQPLPKTDAKLWYSEADNGPSEKVTAILNQVQAQAVPALEEARAAIREYTALAADLRNPKKPLQMTISHLEQITGSIEKGEGLVGKLMSDPKMAEQVNALLPKFNAAFDELQGVLQNLGKTAGNLSGLTASAQEDMKKLPALLDTTKDALTELQITLKDVRKTTAKLPELMEGATTTINTLPGVVLQMQETLRQVQILVEGAQKSWLFRSHIDQSEPIGRIRSDEIGK
jgi:phospholipid/cholesterol/gamma-HCH transport system substrate-binding protein